MRLMPTDTSAPPARLPRWVFLDYLRVFAFGSVLIGHKFLQPLQAAMDDANSVWHWPARLLWPWVLGGGAGVVVFFLVSGYIITAVLQRERCVEFLIRRAARIYPLYVIAVLAEYALQVPDQRVPVHTLLLQLSLLGDWTSTPYALAGVEWTLRLELVFYVVMAILKALGWVDWRNGAALPPIYATLVLMLFATRPWPTFTDWGVGGYGYVSLYFPFLLVGSMLQLQERGVVRSATTALFIVWVVVCHYVGLMRWQPRLLDLHFPLLALGLFLVLWRGRRLWPQSSWVLWLSELTYAIYLFHHWTFDRLRDSAARMGAGPIVAQILGVLSLFMLCVLLVRWVERPGICWGRRLSRPRQRVVA
jgi:peptidoglycan/LPS O-acetylase OafA/YrhL